MRIQNIAFGLDSLPLALLDIPDKDDHRVTPQEVSGSENYPMK